MNKARFFVFGTLFVMGMSLFAQNAEADFTVGLTEDGEGAVIKGYKGRAPQVRIPATIQGMPVKELGEGAFVGRVQITSVVIPDGVTTIGRSALAGQQKLTSITIPNTVTAIGDEVFGDCKALRSITIPNSVTSIGARVFEDCTNLESITIPNSVASIGDRAFTSSGLRSITWPASVTKLQSIDTYG
jgi:hypothetical protein